VALAPFFVALRSGGRGRALLLAWLWLVLACCVIANWFPGAVASYFDQPWLVAFVLFLGVAPTAAAPQYMLFALAYHALARRRLGPLLPLLAAAAWVAAELGRVWIFVRNPWGVVGYSQMDLPPLLQIASVTGVYGISFAVVAVNAALAEGVCALRGAAPLPQAARGLALAALPAAGVLVFGLVSLGDAEGRGEDREAGTPIALVQANLPLGSRWRSDMYGENLDTYLRLTREAAAEGAKIVFWPEAAMTFFLEEEPVYRRGLARYLSSLDLELVAGGPRASR
jgi:apolipoprotein N-acyltransferase